MGEEGPYIEIKVGAGDTEYSPAVGDPVTFTPDAIGTVVAVGPVTVVTVPSTQLKPHA